ncbi:uncharacterized protein LOC114740172 [Neltuma alba]|uniref:uncharacterized protein LOC114740172 n=1 Tax=Neltuma alba TaxID=207710 RepID=UPI0010A4377F|nr:uncharacterized protein LOC114740172 [Prosopis alba]
MPKYAKCLKDMLSKKRRLTEYATVALTKATTSIIKPYIPLKCKDPGSFSIPCLIGEQFKGRALCDLGSAVNLIPLFVFKKLHLGEASPMTVTLQLANRSLSYLYGVIKDVLVKVESLIYPADFIIINIKKDEEIPLIVGRPFMATVKALVDVEKGTISVRFGDEQLTFNIEKIMKHPNIVE